MGPWFGTGGVWTRKVAISLPDSDSDGTASDWTIALPTGLDDFWDRIDSAGNELRVTDAAGNLLTYDLASFNKTTRTGTLELNDVANPNTPHCQLAWLFYGSTSNQGDARTNFAPSTPKTGYIELARPGGPYRVRHHPQIPGTTLPLKTFAKSASEVADLWIQYGARGAILPHNSAPSLEGLYYITQRVWPIAGTPDQTAMYDISLARFVWGPGIGMWARVIVQAGSSGSNYTSAVLARQVGPIGGLSAIRAVHETRIGWRVRDNLIST